MKLRLLIVALSIACFSSAQETLRKFVYFDYNSSALTAESKATLDQMQTDVSGKTLLKIELYGHTDSDGDDAANMELSEQRVASVKSYLVAKGNKETLFTTQSFGETKPALPNSTEHGKETNRRVEIVFTYRDALIVDDLPDEPVAPGRPIMHSGMELKRLPLSTENVQTFSVKASKVIDVTGAKGTHLRFETGSFVNAKGQKVNGDITLRLIEVYSRSEMINQQLSTVCNGQLLESGGMFYVSAYAGNERLSLSPGMEYDVSLPTTDYKDGMILFNGDTSGTNVNWQVQGSLVTKSEYEGGKKILYDGYDSNQTQLNDYVFKSSSLGWINCDHFLNEKNLTSLFVDAGDTMGKCYCLIFKDINSVMQIGSRDNGVEFRNVPVGRKATVLVFRKTDNATWFATKDITIGKDNTEKIEPVQMTEAEFQTAIEQFN